MTENSKFVEYSTPSNIRSFFYFVPKKIRRIFEAVEYSKIFSFCGKKNSSNIRSHRIFDEFRAHERRSNIRRLYSKNIWIQKFTQKIHIRSYSTNFLRISKIEYLQKNSSNISYRCCLHSHLFKNWFQNNCNKCQST